jgi:hypothetical protein
MTTVRRSSRLAAKEVPTPSERKEVLKAVSTLSDRKEFQPKEEPTVKKIELKEPIKVTVRKPLPKLVDYDSDDSQRTISDIVTLPPKPFLVKTETVKPRNVTVVKYEDDFTNVIVKDIVEENTEQIVKDIPMPSLEPFPVRKPVDNKPAANKSVSTTDFEEIDGSKSLAYLVEPSLLTKAKQNNLKGNSVSTSNLKARECLICKRTTFLNKLKDYLNIIENSIGNFQISLIVELFEFIEKNFDYINTKEFDSNKRLIIVIHTKAVSLQEELDYKIKCTNPQYTNDIAMFNNAKKLLQRVHTKCHLYGMDKFVIADPIYKKFLDTFIDQYIQL